MSPARQRRLDAGSARRCYYATDPAGRPHCQLSASVRYGRVELCSSCQQLRFTLGKGQASIRLPRPAPTVDWEMSRDRDRVRRAGLTDEDEWTLLEALRSA